ncbi:MAG: phosphotransferase [Microthrixaceae bacterium]
MSLPIVTAPEGLTATWLTEALADPLAGGRVAEVHHEPVGTGQVGDVFRLAMRLEGAPAGCPRSVIAKLPAGDETSRATGVAVRSYELECRFYEQLAANLPVRTPTCHQVLFDPETHAFTLLFEDLAPARQGDQIVGCSADEAAAVVEEMTQLHAPRFGDASLASIGWMNRRDPDSVAQVTALATMVLPGFCERYGDRLGADETSAYERMVAGLGEILGHHEGPNTVVHGDFRLDNLLFGVDDGTRVAVVDFQGAGCGPGTSDLAYFLGSGLLPDDRRANEEALVADYRTQLLSRGVSGYSADECWLGYRRGTFSGMVVTLVASMLVQQTARGNDMFVAMGGRFARHALDLDAFGLL